MDSASARLSHSTRMPGSSRTKLPPPDIEGDARGGTFKGRGGPIPAPFDRQFMYAVPAGLVRASQDRSRGRPQLGGGFRGRQQHGVAAGDRHHPRTRRAAGSCARAESCRAMRNEADAQDSRNRRPRPRARLGVPRGNRRPACLCMIVLLTASGKKKSPCADGNSAAGKPSRPAPGNQYSPSSGMPGPPRSAAACSSFPAVVVHAHHPSHGRVLPAAGNHK